MKMLLKTILKETNIIESNDDAGDVSVDKAMTEKTLTDSFDVGERGLNYIKDMLEKLNKKAKRLGLEPLSIDVEKSYDVDVYIDRKPIKKRMHKIRIIGKSPIIQGYEFIASVEHTGAGNIINMAPHSSIPSLPEKYRTTNNFCDHCHTKRDRLNTFVLKDTKSNELKQIGRSCLKNFLPDKSPNAIIEYAQMLENALRAGVAAEEFDDYDQDGGGSRWSRYYPADVFFYNVCLAYKIEGRFISAKKARESGMSSDKMLQSTADFAWFLERGFRDMDEETRKYWHNKISSHSSGANTLFEDVKKWMEDKDWEIEIQKHSESNPGLAQYFNNLKIVANMTTIDRKNSNLHASLLAVYLREIGDKEKRDQQAQAAKTKSYVGKVGEKIEILANVKKMRELDGAWGTTWMISLEDNSGNDIIWFASVPPPVSDADIEEKKTFKVKATVKRQDVSKYTGAPQTIITRAKLLPQG